MEKKKFNKMLCLNKETISILNRNNMIKIKGGGDMIAIPTKPILVDATFGVTCAECMQFTVDYCPPDRHVFEKTWDDCSGMC